MSVHANLAVDLFHHGGLYILVSLSDLLSICIIQKFPTFKRDQKGSFTVKPVLSGTVLNGQNFFHLG